MIYNVYSMTEGLFENAVPSIPMDYHHDPRENISHFGVYPYFLDKPIYHILDSHIPYIYIYTHMDMSYYILLMSISILLNSIYIPYVYIYIYICQIWS